MFERFDDAARGVVVSAQEHARALGHPFIGSEHLLLALATTPGVTATCLARHASVERLVEIVTELNAGSVQELPGHIPFTPSGKKALELALREALVNSLDRITAGVLLLGLLRQEGEAHQVLVTAGVDIDALRNDTLATLDEELEVGAEGSVDVSAVQPRVRAWPSPRCHGCRQSIAANAQLRTLPVRDRTTGTESSFQFLYCGNCGTAFAIERVRE